MKDRLRKEANGAPCMFRLPEVCNGDSATTVLCHLRKAGDGMGAKPNDLNGGLGCSSCHDVVDFRVKHSVQDDPDFDKWVHDGHKRTLDYWIRIGSVAIRA
jgi:hypothetical protein